MSPIRVELAHIKAHLTLSGDDFDPADITLETGITPTYIRYKDEILRSGRAFGHYEWGIESSLHIGLEIKPAVKELIGMVSCDTATLAEIALKHNAQWDVLIYTRCSPVMCFDAEQIKFFAEIGASVGFDNYCMQPRSPL